MKPLEDRIKERIEFAVRKLYPDAGEAEVSHAVSLRLNKLASRLAELSMEGL